MLTSSISTRLRQTQRNSNVIWSQTELLNGANWYQVMFFTPGVPKHHLLLSKTDAVSAPLTLVAVLGMRGPCMSFSLDSSTRSCFFSRICLARTRISCISSSSLSSSESYSPARSFSSSSFSRYSSFYKRQHFNFQRKKNNWVTPSF